VSKTLVSLVFPLNLILNPGLHILSQFTSLGAIHDSSERFPPPKCHPDTRHEVIGIVMRWIEDDNPDSSVFWIYGPAGAGKSAIVQTLAELIQASGRCYGGSFFFSRGKIGRDQAHHLFTTIAYQLAFHNTSFREHLNQILYENPTLPSKPINIQMQALIVEPLAKLNGSLHSVPVIIVDGLDECNGHDAQQLILTVIAEAQRKSRTSLRFLVASRPEAHIRETFDSNQLYTMTRRLVLDEKFNPNKDIEVYLKDGFNSIYEQHKQFMADIEKPWPSDGVIDLLVQKASGQFIYAATVLKFVGEEYYRPNKQLDIVLQPTPRRSTAFPDLDALYTQILLTCPHRASLLLILGTILTFHCPQLPEVIEDIFQMERNEVNLVLRSLRSLVRIPGLECHGSQHDEEAEGEDDKGLRFYHASFHDFLVDQNRSGPFYINLEDFLSKFTTSGFRVISRFMPATFTR
jgi:NACHT domain